MCGDISDGICDDIFGDILGDILLGDNIGDTSDRRRVRAIKLIAASVSSGASASFIQNTRR